MRQSFTAVIERDVVLTGDFETEPYEAGWASEVRLFVDVLEASDDEVTATFQSQVSPDGLRWCDGELPPLIAKGPGMRSNALCNFGSWLRLRGKIDGPEGWVRVSISLALKE